MALTVQTGIPCVITAGDAVSFLVSDSDFPAPTWTSKVSFKDEAGAVKQFDGAASGTGHLFELTNANTATLVAGQNSVCVIFNDGTNRQTSEWQSVLVLSDPTSQSPPSYAQTQVTLLREVIAKFSGSNIKSFSSAGHSFSRYDLPDYQSQLLYWEARLLREQRLEARNRGIHHGCETIAPEFVNDSPRSFGSVGSCR